MKYYSVPVTNGRIDVDYDLMVEGVVISDSRAYISVDDHHPPRPSWEPITIQEFSRFRVLTYSKRITQIEQVLDTLLEGSEAE